MNSNAQTSRTVTLTGASKGIGLAGAWAVMDALEQPENMRLDEILVDPTSQSVEF